MNDFIHLSLTWGRERLGSVPELEPKRGEILMNSEIGEKYPSRRWILRTLRKSLVAPMRVNLLDAYIVGSEAKGTARLNSDLDIALVISTDQELKKWMDCRPYC
jgi:hypothetical protein